MRINTNLYSGIFFLTLGTAALFIIPAQIPVGLTDYGPRLFPYIVSAVMIISSIGLLASECLDQMKRQTGKERSIEMSELDSFELKRVGLMFLLMTVYIFLLEPLGFILSSILFACGMLVFFKSRSIICYGVCIGLIVGIYYGFRIFLRVYLP